MGTPQLNSSIPSTQSNAASRACIQTHSSNDFSLAGSNDRCTSPSDPPVSSFRHTHPDLTLIENLLLKEASRMPIWHLGPTEPELMFFHCQMAQPLPEASSNHVQHQTLLVTSSKAARMCLLAQSCASLHSVSKRVTILKGACDGALSSLDPNVNDGFGGGGTPGMSSFQWLEPLFPFAGFYLALRFQLCSDMRFFQCEKRQLVSIRIHYCCTDRCSWLI